MLEQSVKLSRLISFYFISNFLLYAPILPNREPKTSAFRGVFVLERFFSSSVVVSVAKVNREFKIRRPRTTATDKYATAHDQNHVTVHFSRVVLRLR